MTPIALLDLLKKHGALGVLAIWLFYTNERLTDVERELYRCYDKFQACTDVKTRTHEKTTYYAVPPKEFEIKHKRG